MRKYFLISEKKVLTFGSRFGILLKLSVTHDAAEKIFQKKKNSALTMWMTGCIIIMFRRPGGRECTL